MHRTTLETTGLSHWKGVHLHIFTCGTATTTKMIWITLFLNLIASSAVVSVGNLSFRSAVINVEMLSLNLKVFIYLVIKCDTCNICYEVFHSS